MIWLKKLVWLKTCFGFGLNMVRAFGFNLVDYNYYLIFKFKQ